MRQIQTFHCAFSLRRPTLVTKILMVGLMGFSLLSMMGCSLFRKSTPPPPPTLSSPPPPAPSVRADSDILAEARQQVQESACCSAVVKDVRSGVLSLEGHVDNEEQRQKIRRLVEQIPGVREIKDTTAIFPQVFRQAINLLTPFQTKGQQAGSITHIQPHKGCNNVYSDTESLILDITLSSPARYVYADYYIADHEIVAHLFPNPFQTDNFLKTNTSLTLGGKSSPVRWQIQSPFGVELLTVITSSQPLFDRKRIEPEGVTNYLADLRSALPADASSSDVETAYCIITSRGKDEKAFAGGDGPQGAATATTPAQASQGQDSTPQQNEANAPPQDAVASPTSAAADEAPPTLSVDFFDVTSFDRKLSSVLKNDPPEVTLNFTAPVSLNNVPPRLDKWFATVEHHDGAVALMEDPKQQGPTSRFVASLGVTLAIGAYELIKNKFLYGPAKDYNATVYYVKGTGAISRVVFTHK